MKTFVTMNIIIPLLLFIAHSIQGDSSLQGIPATLPKKQYFDKIINEVNSAGAKWEAGHNFESAYDTVSIHHLLGSVEFESDHNEDTKLESIMTCDHTKVGHGDEDDGHHHSKEFDGRAVWKHCPSVMEVKNQGKCASDWVVTPVAAITDRICIYTNGTKQLSLSAHEPISCCKTCGWGCKKGYPKMVYKYYVKKGFVTGGNYKSNKGCQPYEIKPCRNYKQCLEGSNAETPTCKPYCYNKNYKQKYSDDVNKGYSYRQYSCPFCAGDELKKRGPLTGTMDVYEDFLAYKSGIYHHVSGKKLGKLTVKLIGFNDTVSDNKYWIAVNSWGTKWGDKGFFKIQRGNNECMIDSTLRCAWVENIE